MKVSSKTVSHSEIKCRYFRVQKIEAIHFFGISILHRNFGSSTGSFTFCGLSNKGAICARRSQCQVLLMNMWSNRCGVFFKGPFLGRFPLNYRISMSNMPNVISKLSSNFSSSGCCYCPVLLTILVKSRLVLILTPHFLYIRSEPPFAFFIDFVPVGLVSIIVVTIFRYHFDTAHC